MTTMDFTPPTGFYEPTEFDLQARDILKEDGWICCCESEEASPSGTWCRYNQYAPFKQRYGTLMSRSRALAEAQPVRVGRLMV